MKLSERETAALVALPEDGTPLSGTDVAKAMTAAGVNTRSIGAYRTCAGLVNKGLAADTYVDGLTGAVIGYKLTAAGRSAAAILRARS